MALYELVYMARQDLTEAQVTEMTTGFTKVITDQKGSVANTEYWGLRQLAYKINKARKAHYVLMHIDCEAAALHELERQMGLDENVMRHLTIRLEEFPSEPSIMMRGDNDNDTNEKEAA